MCDTRAIQDELVRESHTWHEQVPPGASIRPEDVILAAFVALRQIAVSDMFVVSALLME